MGRLRSRAVRKLTNLTSSRFFKSSVPIQKFLPAFCVCLKGAPAEPFN